MTNLTRISILVLTAFSVACASQSVSEEPAITSPSPDAMMFPDWHGTWVGKLENLPEREGAPDVDVSLVISAGPDEADGCLSKTMTYSQSGEVQQVKDYQLCRAEDGSFFTDEGEGIELPASINGGVFYSVFSVGGSILVTREAVEKDSYTQEIIFAPESETNTLSLPKTETPGPTEMKTIPVSGMQRVVLTRQAASPQ